MEVRITDCLKTTGQRVDFDEVAKFKFDDEEFKSLSPVRMKGYATGLGTDRVMVTVRAQCEVILHCCRCNQPMRHKMNFEYEELYAKNPDEDLFAEDPSFPIIEDSRIYLDEGFRQNCMGQIPLQPVCKADCKISPILDPARTDPRWAALQALKNPNGTI